MSKRTVITREFYDKLVIAYRECPGNASFAARQALCDPRTARRAWAKGFTAMGLKPIAHTLEDEAREAQAAARTAAVRAQEDAEAKREAARQESIEAHAQEKQMLKVARADVLAALVLSADLVGAMRAAVNAIKRELEPSDGSQSTIKPALAMALLTRHTQMIQRAVGAAEAVIQLSRLDRGAPNLNLGLGVADEDITPEAIDEELEAIGDVLAATRSHLKGPAQGVRGALGVGGR